MPIKMTPRQKLPPIILKEEVSGMNMEKQFSPLMECDLAGGTKYLNACSIGLEIPLLSGIDYSCSQKGK